MTVMADLTQLQNRIRELEARRAKGESVPELDALYSKMDALTNKGYEEATKSLSGEPLPGKPSDKDKKPENLPGRGKTQKLGEGMTKYASGGKVSSASKRADGIAQRGKTRGKIC
jgi:hypothetical protein